MLASLETVCAAALGTVLSAFCNSFIQAAVTFDLSESASQAEVEICFDTYNILSACIATTANLAVVADGTLILSVTAGLTRYTGNQVQQ